MKKILLGAGVLFALALLWVARPFYWPEDLGEDDLSEKTGFDSVDLPSACWSSAGDHCALFECLTGCWCAEPEGVLFEGDGFVLSEQEAEYALEGYLASQGGGLTVTHAVDLVAEGLKGDGAFYNVFAEDASGNEEVFTVAADGTIIKTACGV